MDQLESRPAALTGRDALRALAAKAGGTPFPLPDVAPVMDIGKKLGSKIGALVEATVEKTVWRQEHALSSEDLDYILGHMFVNVKDWNPQQPQQNQNQNQNQNNQNQNQQTAVLSGCKASPRGHLLSMLSVFLAVVHVQSGLRGLATVWSEFVLEVRWHWENLKLIPRIDARDGPDMRCALLHQKLQMINACIERQIARNKQRETGGSESEEDEFYLAPEDEEGAQQRLQRMQQDAKVKAAAMAASAASAASADASSVASPQFLTPTGATFPSDPTSAAAAAATVPASSISTSTSTSTPASGKSPHKHNSNSQLRPIGVKTVHASLKLLETGQPLRVPVTQEPGKWGLCVCVGVCVCVCVCVRCIAFHCVVCVDKMSFAFFLSSHFASPLCSTNDGRFAASATAGDDFQGCWGVDREFVVCYMH